MPSRLGLGLEAVGENRGEVVTVTGQGMQRRHVRYIRRRRSFKAAYLIGVTKLVARVQTVSRSDKDRTDAPALG